MARAKIMKIIAVPTSTTAMSFAIPMCGDATVRPIAMDSSAVIDEA